MYGVSAKVAVTALSPVIETVSGLLEPEASPLHPVNM